MKKFERPDASIREDGVDLINNMSDHILLLILSGLSSIEEVIRTSILSTRWRYFWTLVPSVELRYPELPDKYHPMKKFKEFVYWILVNRFVDFDRLHLFCSDLCNSSTIGQCIHAAITKNVKQIDFTYMLILFMHDSSSLCFLSP
ncbi:unnamed protein product [Lactuca saligna]|uniref:F-box domain-containing protein n=1 Tax=Lactuca saligna TaxID=75948 RepID=A0AA35Z3S0_LACSI|nr:unnamed protein product [Lactuca saligna]